MLVRLFRGPFLNVFLFFLKIVSLFILYFSTNNSIIITKREICEFFLSQLSLARAILSQQTPKNTTTFIATFWKSSREIRNFRPELSQKRPAKSWGDWLMSI